VGPQRHRLRYAVQLAVEELVRTSSVCTFDTFTFAENVQDKKEAGKRWLRLKARLKRHYPGLRGVGVWQRQKRGAWHLHYVFDRMLDIHNVRPWGLACGFGPFLNMRQVGTLPGFREGWTFQRVGRYMARYLERDLVDGRDKGVRVVDYCGDSRKATTAFRFVNGLGRLWRAGRQVWADMIADGIYDRQPDFNDMWFVVRLGWETFSEDERLRMLENSDAVAQWWSPERYPF